MVCVVCACISLCSGLSTHVAQCTHLLICTFICEHQCVYSCKNAYTYLLAYIYNVYEYVCPGRLAVLERWLPNTVTTID